MAGFNIKCTFLQSFLQDLFYWYSIHFDFFFVLLTHRKSNSTPDNGKTPAGSSKPTNNAGTNCAPLERPQENAERRSYYQELAGIDHQCTTQDTDHESDGDADNLDNELPLGASANRTHMSQRHSRTSPHHRRSKSYEPQTQSSKKQALLPHMNQEMLAKCRYAQRHHRDYHMQLLEASRSRLEGLQPHMELQANRESPCRHSMKRHSFPATPVQVVTTQVVAPESPPQVPAVKGKHRRKSRRHHTLQPLTVMKHEVLEKTEGVVIPPMTQKHQHHHHHEHHHHHHYHHYHDID